MIVSSLGSKEVAWLVLGFLFFVVVPSEEAESWLAKNKPDDERGFLAIFLGFQLEIEAISALVILPVDSDGVEAICSADLDEESVEASSGGLGSPCHSQS